ncbi:hypothetical protein RsoM2USA_49 [Ralstonia phage RsoM2USA]|nr:hypothetical protein RsoM2USA_49 [Ralstonia phage RsoM2USA]
MSTFTSVSQILAELNQTHYVDVILAMNFIANDGLIDPSFDGNCVKFICEHYADMDRNEFESIFGKVEPIDFDTALQKIIDQPETSPLTSDEFGLFTAYYDDLRHWRKNTGASLEEVRYHLGAFMKALQEIRKVDINEAMFIILTTPDSHDNLNVVVAACVAQYDKKTGEINMRITVDEDLRGQGLATSMFKKAVMFAEVKNVSRIYLSGLSQSEPMKHLVQKMGLNLVADGVQHYGDSNITVIDKSLHE